MGASSPPMWHWKDERVILTRVAYKGNQHRPNSTQTSTVLWIDNIKITSLSVWQTWTMEYTRVTLRMLNCRFYVKSFWEMDIQSASCDNT